MKQALIVSITEVVKHPPLKSRSRILCFLDLEEGEKWVKENKNKVINTHYAEVQE